MSLQIPQYLVGGRRVREEHAVAQAVEGLAQRRKAGGRGAVDRRDAEALGEPVLGGQPVPLAAQLDRKSTRLNSSHSQISYAVFCLKKKNKEQKNNSNASRKQ